MGTGYLSTAYALAMSGHGRPLPLAQSGATLVIRPIPGHAEEDAAAPYPFLLSANWAGLAADIAALPSSLVSLAAVTDPFAGSDEESLGRAFNHIVRPYKPHYIIDLTRPLESFADRHHLGCARSALKKLAIECCAAPLDHFEDWMALYANLIARHGLRGAGVMDPESLQRQFQVPGFRLFRAGHQGRTVGMIAVMETDDRAYFHLGAYSEEGYRLNASYALVRGIIDHYRHAGFSAMSIGGGAGAFGTDDTGLARFKRGFASGSLMTYLCGHIIDARRYAALAAAMPQRAADYFPAYRAGEFD